MFYALSSWWRYYKDAVSIYSVHSPFVYDFILDVLDTSKVYYHFESIELERKALLKNHDSISFIDYGAGSKKSKDVERKISNVAKYSLSNQKQGRLLFNLVVKYQPMKILELGSSLGISTLYLSKARLDGTVYTLEGNPASAKIAANIYERHTCKNIKLSVGTFDLLLPNVLKEMERVDLAFIDGNHTYEATMAYFNSILPYCNVDSILIFDDIYWSRDMERAWQEIKAHNKVTLTIDLYELGIVFFHGNREKLEVKLIEWWKKIWNIGIWG